MPKQDHSTTCSEKIIKILRKKLSDEELDMLNAAVCYDTSNFQGLLETESSKHMDKCEKEHNNNASERMLDVFKTKW